MKKLLTIKYISRFIFTIFSTCLITFVIFSNLAPFGLTVNFSDTDGSKDISTLGPKERVEKISENNVEFYKQKSDLVYFDVNMPFQFDNAIVSITYKNRNPNQDIFLGYKDQEYWHYNAGLIDSTVINSISWKGVGQNPTLYQKNPNFSSFAAFIKNPPKNAIVGTYDYDPTLLTSSKLEIPDFKSTNSATIINVALRGKHTFYAYLQQQPFRLKITKQDLNWYNDPDPVNIDIYKDKDKVFSAIIDDDGITDDSKKSNSSQDVEIQNPGPGLPEDGVYKVVIDASSDTIITRIETNLQKIVFDSPIFPAGNKSVYSLINSTTPTTLYTNSLLVAATTYHDKSFQKIKIGDEILDLRSLSTEVASASSGPTIEMNIPTNDVILKGILGYFSFTKDQFFTPTAFKVLPVTSSSDLELIDYLVADYALPLSDGGWNIATRTFDIKNSVIKDGKLSWVIKAPGLKENKGSILIKNINITLSKKPLIGI